MPGSKAHAAYRTDVISERHRHRYEVNNDYRARLDAAGMCFSGTSPDGSLVEVIELPNHPWFVGMQCHPEFKSKPTQPHPLFRDFIGASLENRRQKKADGEGGSARGRLWPVETNEAPRLRRGAPGIAAQFFFGLTSYSVASPRSPAP